MAYDMSKKLEEQFNERLSVLMKELQTKITGRLSPEELIVKPETYERKSYDPLSDEELKSQSQAELSDKLSKEKNSIINNINSELKKLERQKSGITEDQLSKLKDIETSYSKLLEGINNDTMKRGLQRSSIATGQVERANYAQKEDVLNLNNESKNKLRNIENDINDLEINLEKSLNDFDIQSANKITTRINELKIEQAKILNEVNEYNNNLTKKEAQELAEYNKKLAEAYDNQYKEQAAILNNKNDTGYASLLNAQYKINYDMAIQFYTNIPRDEAKNLISENTKLKEYLGEYFYNQLKNKLNGG